MVDTGVETNEGTIEDDGFSLARSILSIFSQAVLLDNCLMEIGCVGAIANGHSFPITMFFFHSVVNDVGSSMTSDSPPNGHISHALNIVLFLAAGSFVACFLGKLC
ncbi:hypothetical protein HPP92_004736 [Vanilla planifolia]|uniref:Uncharacterized protein n=1 Tax=Vanilla planifolia TaxID=51239 RepID=A0A835RIZ0_VANPL|nr:hypothetical protein HPP92_004736 [Vanilla planifolia]